MCAQIGLCTGLTLQASAKLQRGKDLNFQEIQLYHLLP